MALDLSRPYPSWFKDYCIQNHDWIKWCEDYLDHMAGHPNAFGDLPLVSRNGLVQYMADRVRAEEERIVFELAGLWPQAPTSSLPSEQSAPPDAAGGDMTTADAWFGSLRRGSRYSRNDLARLWGYVTYHPLARGLVAPQGAKLLLLFVTCEKQTHGYENRLVGDTLYWEGPSDHFCEDRLITSGQRGDDVHLFLRRWHREDFTYYGTVSLLESHRNVNCPSRFVFKLEP